MAQSVGRLSKRLVMLFMALVVIMGSLLPGLVVTPAQAGILPITRTYIQTTIDTTNWEILAGVVSYEAGTNAHQVEAKRMGASNLELLAKSTTPSDSGVYDALDAGVGKAGDNTIKNLVLCFPGTMSFSGWNDNSTAEDTSRAQLIRNSMIYDLNAAFKFVYADANGIYTPKVTSGDDTLDARIDQYAKDLSSFLSHIPGTVGESFGKNGAKIVATEYPKNPVDADIADANYGKDYYVTIQRGDETRTFLYRMLKGYGVEGTGLPKVDGDATKYIHWGTLCLEAFVNYFSDEELQVTADTVYNSTPGAIESTIADLLGGFAEWVANTLGLWNFDELIFNSGVRGTSGYVGGVFPTNWEQIIWTFFFFSEVAAIIMLLYAIIYNVGRKAMATIDPVARASAIEQIKYLFIVAFLLAILPVVLPLLISVSAELTGIFHDSLGGLTAEERFKKLSSVSGTLGSVLTYLLYLGALIYFNVFYVFRALSLALMIILGPIFVAMMAISENKRQLALAWFKEFSANLFIQPLQALMLSFILLVPDTGRNIDSIVMAYVMIPLTNLLRQLFFGSGGSLADRVGQQGKQAGVSMLKKAGGVAVGAGLLAAGGTFGAAKGAISGGATAVMSGIKTARDSKTNNGENAGKESNNTGSPNTKGGSGDTDSGGEKKEGQAGEKKKGAAAAVGAASPVSPGAAGSKTPLSEAAAENTGAADGDADGKPDSDNAGNSDSGEKAGAAGTSGGETGPKSMSKLNRTARIAGGLALAAVGGVGLGAIAGGINGLTGRRYFGGPGGNGLVNQLSRAAATKGGSLMAEGITGRRSNAGAGGNPVETPPTTAKERQEQYCGNKDNYANGGNAFTSAKNRGDVLQTGNKDGTSTYSFKDKAAQANAGIDNIGRAGKGAYTVTYNKDQLSDNDLSNFEQLQNIMENGTAQEKEALAAAGITGFDPIYQWNSETGQKELSGATVTYDAKKAQENFGLGRGENGTLTATAKGDEAPSFVPDANSYLNSSKAAVNYGASMLNKDGFDTSVDFASGMVTASADAKTFQTTNMPDNLMQYAQNAKVGKDGTMSMQIPQEEMVKAFGGVPTGSNTQIGRSVAADMSAEGIYIPPTQDSTAAPRTMSTAARSGMESLQSQGFNVAQSADGSGYTISGTAQTVGAANIPSGLADTFRSAVPDEQGNVSMFVPTQDFAGSYAATQTGHAAGGVPMATIGTHNAAAPLADQGVTIRPDPNNNGTVNLVAQKGADLNSVNATPEVAQAIAQLNQQMQSGGGNVLNVPASTFNGYTGGTPAAENLVNAGSYMPQPAPEPPTAASPIPAAPQEEYHLPRRQDPESGARDDDEFPIDIGAILMHNLEKSGEKAPPAQKNSPIHPRRGGEA